MKITKNVHFAIIASQMVEFVVVRCVECGLFQMGQKRKDGTFGCKVCGVKQARQRVYGTSQRAGELRSVVQALNQAAHAPGQKAGDMEKRDDNGAEWGQFGSEPEPVVVDVLGQVSSAGWGEFEMPQEVIEVTDGSGNGPDWGLYMGNHVEEKESGLLSKGTLPDGWDSLPNLSKGLNIEIATADDPRVGSMKTKKRRTVIHLDNAPMKKVQREKMSSILHDTEESTPMFSSNNHPEQTSENIPIPDSNNSEEVSRGLVISAEDFFQPQTFPQSPSKHDPKPSITQSEWTKFL